MKKNTIRLALAQINCTVGDLSSNAKKIAEYIKNAQSAGADIVSFPELSTERRQEFVKLIKKMAEDNRVSVRHVRRDAMDLFKKHAHDSGITEDDKKQAEKDLQKLTDDYTAKIDAHVASKEKEIMTV